MAFVPGQTGNPRGRPAGYLKDGSRITDHLNYLVKSKTSTLKAVSRYLENLDQKNKLGNITVARLIACKLLMMAIAGNVEAIKMVFDRIDGRVRDDVAIALPAINIQTNVLVHSGTVDASTQHMVGHHTVAEQHQLNPLLSTDTTS